MRLQPQRPSMWHSMWHSVFFVAALLVCHSVERCQASTVCSGMCPVVDETKCTCTIKPLIAGSSQIGNYLSCSGLGNITYVPNFSCSPSLTEFSITSSSLAEIQRLAFAGIKAESLWMTGLEISIVNEQAFSGLESVLKTISFGYNNIQVLAGNTFTRLVQLGSIVLEHNKLTEIASGLFRNLSQVVNINLQWNSISTVHGDAFDGLDSLQTLDISDNFIAELPANFLIGAAQVRELRLAGNRIISLISPAFNAMPNMITLDLSRNLLNYLPANMLPGCPKLNILYLSWNNISSISSLAIAALSELQIIYAQNNNIGLIPSDAFQNAFKLKVASFANNKISQLDVGLFRNTLILQTLNLSCNSIPSVPDDVFPQVGSGVNIFDISYNRLSQANFLVRLANLIIADVSNNQIEVMNFTVTPQLNVLKASFNRMRRFSKEQLARLSMLKELYLDNNLIDSVELGLIERNLYIQILSLGNNLLSDVPLLNGTRLTVLRLNDNRISSMSYLNCPVLSELYLQNNLLGTITSNMFVGLTNLRILDLSNNSILSVPQFGFATVNNLQVLRLANNGISIISSENFYGLSNLRSLDMSGNDLQTLTYGSMSDLLAMKLTAMYLAFNPFICSCEVLWVRGSRALQDTNNSVCFINDTCHRLMCNPVKRCPQPVSPLYNDDDPFCLEVPDACPKATTLSSTPIATSTPFEMSSVTFPLETNTASTEPSRRTTNTVIHWTETSESITVASLAAEESKKSSIYIIIGVVVGVVLLIIFVIILVCLIRKGLRNRRKDPLKQDRDYRGSINDEIGILKGEQSSELEDLPPAPVVDPTIEKQSQLLPIPTMSEPDLNSSFRPRPKGSVGFPFGNFRIPGSDGRRWRAGGQVDRPPYEFDDAPNEPEAGTNEVDDDEDVPDRKRRRNESQFIDEDRKSNSSGDFQFPSKFTNYLLWRGGQKDPYKTEKLPGEKEDDEDNEKKKKKGVRSEFADDLENNSCLSDSSKHGGDLLWRGGNKGLYKTEKLPKDWDHSNEDEEITKRKQEKVKSEFIDDQEDAQFQDLDDFGQNGKLGNDLLWRGGGKGPYMSEKLPKDYCKDNGDDPYNKNTAKLRGNVTGFDDDGDRSGISGDFRVPSALGEGLLWRRGQNGPYDAEKLPKGFCKDDDEGNGLNKQKQSKLSLKIRSEFNGNENDFPSSNSDRFRAGLLWRGAKKDPYLTEKLGINETEDDTSKEKSGTTTKNQRKGRLSAFVGDGEQLPPLNSDEFRMPVAGTDLLWRGTQKGPYSSAKFASEYSDEPNAKSTSVKMRVKPDKRKSEFMDDEAAFASSSTGGFRLPSKAGTDLLWKSAQRGPYASEKLSKDFAALDETANDTSKKKERKLRRRVSNPSDYIDSASETYATGNFRFPSMTGDDILWRVGQKRPYSTVRLPKDYCDSGISSYAGTSQTHGKIGRKRKQQRRKSNETEYMDSDGSSSLYSSYFGGFRIPGTAGDRSPSNLQWRTSRFGDDGSTSPHKTYPDQISLDGVTSGRSKRDTEFSSDLDDRSNLSDPYQTSFGNFKTSPNKRPNTLYWKADRMSTGLTPTSKNSSPGSFERNSGNDMDTYSDDNRKPESPASDHIRKSYGTAKAATAWKKTQIQNGNLPRIETDVEC